MLRLNPLLELRLLCCVASLEAKLSQVCRRNLTVFNSHYGLGLNWFYPDLKFQFVKFRPQCDSINELACWIVLEIWLLQQRNSFQLLHQLIVMILLISLADGEHIAIASQDGNIYVHAVYDEGTTYRRVGCCSVCCFNVFLLRKMTIHLKISYLQPKDM